MFFFFNGEYFFEKQTQFVSTDRYKLVRIRKSLKSLSITPREVTDDLTIPEASNYILMGNAEHYIVLFKAINNLNLSYFE